ncbi:PqqD family peptide modification chaperone [Ancylobacter vacuolatus]|uniref:Outer membrane protein assembly factor BamB n=1 Tax=Ancylobacter vacuolatus TaxID=223389 RepID=A0ABU0DEP9_9HYPH|nr:PqqD family peptide modification chaperone [Ancylobacter vacuolatus]MDQ0346813.1 outer membrane protein assembly factor BamB [Ancylobacter vacuolatus]
MLTLQSRICRSPECLTAELEGDIVMMNVENGAYYQLDATGTEIWNRLETPVEIGPLCAELAQLYEGPIDEIERDVLAFLAGLAERGLVVPADVPA